MSDDELEKLAAAMKDMKPSEPSRKQGMDTAMAAFDIEFAANDVKEATPENISSPVQGLEAAPRPTGQSTLTGAVQTLGRGMMAKIDKIFTFKPRTAMLAGSCMAALFATSLYVQNDQFEPRPAISKDVKVSETNSDAAMDMKTVETVTPQGSIMEPVVVQESGTETVTIPALSETEPKEVIVTGSHGNNDSAAQSNGGINSVSNLLDKVRSDSVATKTENENREAAFRPSRDHQSALLNQARGELAQLGVKPATDHEVEPIEQYKATLEQLATARQDAAQQGAQPQIAPAPPPPVIERQQANVAGSELPPGNPMPAPIPIAPVGQATPMPVTTPQAVLSPVVTAPLGARVAPPAPATTLMAEAPALTNTQLPDGYTLEAAPPTFETVTETVVIQEATTELVTVPATYETVTETVVAQEARTELVTIPGEYKWVEGDVVGGTTVYETTPAEYETVTETVVVQEASTELVTIPQSFETVMDTIVVQPQYVAADGSIVPPVTQEISRRVVKTPASTQERVIPAATKTVSRRVVKTPRSTVERFIPYEKKDGKTRVVVTPPRTLERAVPVITKQATRRVIKTPARTQERIIPSVTKQVQVRKLAVPQGFYLRDENGNVVREFASRDKFEIYKSNLPTSVQEKPVSTFSVDVDTASYSFIRASINSGKLPPRSAIRLEELINYFPYDYDAPKSADEPFKANVTVTPTPWNADTKLMHIGIKGYVPPADEKQRSNLVFLLDVSGSMKAANKLPLLVNSFKLLLGTLDANDTVSIVTYAGNVGTVLEPTRANETDKIHAALNSLHASGGTAGGAGLELAYNKALESFDEEGVNRVILATDGDFNIGFSSSDEMKTFIEKKRETGIFLSVLGFGQGNYNDHLMQSLAQNGNGVAAYIDTLAEANKILANEAGSALFTIAKDVKIQVEFNPATISEYRLIGYETRALKRQDFNNDKVDAGDIGAGHSVTAIYEMTPVGSPAITNDPLRYVTESLNSEGGSDEFAFVKIRHKLPDADTSSLQTFPISKGHERRLKQASDDMRFAAAVAAVGQKLRGDTPLEDFSYKDAIKLASQAKGDDEHGYRAEFIQLVRLMESLEK